MNDIRLIKQNTPDEKYDWSFEFNDLDIVRGKMQLINAVRHAVLLRPGELVQDPYQLHGCPAHDYILLGNTTNGQIQVCNHIEASAKEVQGVYNATARVAESTDEDFKVTLTLITDDMEEVTLNEI